MENQRKDMIGLQPTEPDLLYQKPTNHAKRTPMEQNKREQFIIRRIGGKRVRGFVGIEVVNLLPY